MIVLVFGLLRYCLAVAATEHELSSHDFPY